MALMARATFQLVAGFRAVNQPVELVSWQQSNLERALSFTAGANYFAILDLPQVV